MTVNCVRTYILSPNNQTQSSQPEDRSGLAPGGGIPSNKFNKTGLSVPGNPSYEGLALGPSPGTRISTRTSIAGWPGDKFNITGVFNDLRITAKLPLLCAE